jgi:hypothetical protein
MTALAERARRRIRIAIGAGVVSALMLPIGGALAWQRLLNSQSGTSVTATTQEVPSTPAALLAGVGAGGQLSSLAVLALDPSGVGGTVVLVPVGTATEVAAGDTSSRLAEVFAEDGLDGLVAETQAVLDVSFVTAAAYDREQLIDVLAPLGAITVLLDRDVIVTGADGTDVVLATTGEQPLPVDRVVDVLLARRAQESEADRFSRHKEVWTGIVERLGIGLDLAPEVDATPVGLSSMTNFAARMFAGSMQVWQLAAAPVIDDGRNPRRVDMYSLDVAETLMIFASVAPSSLVSADVSMTVMIDSSLNDPLISREAVARLTALGIGVGLVREVQGLPPVKTTVALWVDGADALPDIMRDTFGDVARIEGSLRVDGIDAVVTLGGSFAELVRGNVAG